MYRIVPVVVMCCSPLHEHDIVISVARATAIHFYTTTQGACERVFDESNGYGYIYTLVYAIAPRCVWRMCDTIIYKGEHNYM